jgi:hypothetical protein
MEDTLLGANADVPINDRKTPYQILGMILVSSAYQTHI